MVKDHHQSPTHRRREGTARLHQAIPQAIQHSHICLHIHIARVVLYELGTTHIYTYDVPYIECSGCCTVSYGFEYFGREQL